VSHRQRTQKRWSWIMGGVTLGIALFSPYRWGSTFISFFNDLGYTALLDRILLLSLPFVLALCTIWCWYRLMGWHPTTLRALVVPLAATGLALLLIALLWIVGFGLILSQGNGWGIAIGLFMTLRAGVAFLCFLPWLLIAATVIAFFQRQSQHLAG
jgi:hypothetical protein